MCSPLGNDETPDTMAGGFSLSVYALLTYGHPTLCER